MIPTSNAIGRLGTTVELSPECPAEQKQLIRASQISAHKTPSAPEPPLSLCYVTDREREEGSEMAHAHKTWTSAVSFRVGKLTSARILKAVNGRLKLLQSF
jgi:hypothetical protein